MAAAGLIAAAILFLILAQRAGAEEPALGYELPFQWFDAVDPGGAAFLPGEEFYWGSMTTGAAGISLIKSYEQLHLSAYLDPGGVPTIGWGHTGPDVYLGRTITAEQAAQLFAADLAGAEAAVNGHVLVPLMQGQFDALVSFVFNVGAGAFAESTLLRKLNAGDYAGAKAEFDRWVYDDGVRLAGLVRRRDAEQGLFSA